VPSNLRDDAAATPGGGTKDAPGPRPATRPLIAGREAELSLLRGALQEALNGRTNLVVITAPAGMGKTALLEQALDEARRSGAVGVVGRAWEATYAPPLWPWLQILRELGRDSRFGASTTLQRAVQLLEPAGSGASGRFEMFDQVSAALREVADTVPLVVAFDDAHATDESSVALLNFVARSHASTPLLIVVTQDDSDARTAQDATRSMLVELGREGLRLGLGPLNRIAIARLFEHRAGRPPTETELESVERMSEGNPLFAEEAVELLIAEHDVHRPGYSTGFRVPRGARDLIRQRSSLLDDAVVELLTVASVIGRSFSISTLAELAHLSVDDVVDLVAIAGEAGLVAESGALGEHSFTHILIRETLYEELPVAVKMRLHRAAGEAAEAAPDDGSGKRTAELAHHWFKAAQAGEAERALRYVRAAARDALSQHAYREAARLLHRALNLAVAVRATTEEIDEIQSALDAASSGARTTHTDEPAASVARFTVEGDVCALEFDGATVRLRITKGLRYVGVLLSQPERELHVLDLVQLEGPATGPPAGAEIDTVDPFAGTGPALDARAKAEIKRRIADLTADIEEAETLNDPARGERARVELDALTQHLSAAFGLQGRARPVGSAAERARVSVTKTIKEALRKIDAVHPSLALHLHRSIKTGTFCAYLPDPRAKISWDVTL